MRFSHVMSKWAHNREDVSVHPHVISPKITKQLHYSIIYPSQRFLNFQLNSILFDYRLPDITDYRDSHVTSNRSVYNEAGSDDSVITMAPARTLLFLVLLLVVPYVWPQETTDGEGEWFIINSIFPQSKLEVGQSGDTSFQPSFEIQKPRNTVSFN